MQDPCRTNGVPCSLAPASVGTLAAATGAGLADLVVRLGHSTPAAAMICQHAVVAD